MQNGKTFFARIILKFYEQAGISYTSGNIIEAIYRNDKTRQWQRFIASHPLIQIDRLFTSVSADGLIELVNKAKLLDTKYVPADLCTYYVISCPASVHAREVLLKVNELPGVELAYLQSTTVNPHRINNNGSIIFRDTYLAPSPVGINAQYAWEADGGSGSASIKFIDVEQGWGLEHGTSGIITLPLTGIDNCVFSSHGAAVLDIIMKNDNVSGSSRGIAPHVSGHVISQWRPGGEPNDADAIIAAISYLGFGDILLLEIQSFYSPRNNKVWPAEVQEAVYQAIRLATALGIIVIEAAGNGNITNTSGNDLDNFLANKKKIFNPASKDFKDSGAIIVAASSMNVPHSRIAWSNYGNRINCYAWGEGVVTPGDTGSAKGFGGTSGASAIIAGIAIVVQSISEIKNNVRLSPAQMRHILSSDNYGTLSANGRIKDKIGVMPDLKKIIDHCLV